MKIINCCPHAVTVFTGTIFNPSTGNSTGGSPIISFPKSGYVASAISTVTATEPLEIEGEEVPACKRKFSSVSELPESPDALYIVSSVYAKAAEELGKDTSRLLTPYGEVYTECGHKVGCTALIRY